MYIYISTIFIFQNNIRPAYRVKVLVIEFTKVFGYTKCAAKNARSPRRGAVHLITARIITTEQTDCRYRYCSHRANKATNYHLLIGYSLV